VGARRLRLLSVTNFPSAIERIGRTNTYRLTADGLTFALVYSRVHDQVL